MTHAPTFAALASVALAAASAGNDDRIGSHRPHATPACSENRSNEIGSDRSHDRSHDRNTDPKIDRAERDRRTIAALDTAYQAAVERNDAEAMARILHPDFVVVLGDGTVETRDDVLGAARTRSIEYERQIEEPGTQTVHVWGDTAVVTALLWLKGTRKDGRRFERRLWFTDTYIRTGDGWRYVFGQASLPLPQADGFAPFPGDKPDDDAESRYRRP
ncbi:MAG: nuclear transport factor 2 family protein [Xanthomonadaceae bacterium]|nr:nuclear transport factor 2 family protein [Xanthomonadaceae bacterium]